MAQTTAFHVLAELCLALQRQRDLFGQLLALGDPHDQWLAEEKHEAVVQWTLARQPLVDELVALDAGIRQQLAQASPGFKQAPAALQKQYEQLRVEIAGLRDQLRRQDEVVMQKLASEKERLAREMSVMGQSERARRSYHRGTSPAEPGPQTGMDQQG